MTVSAATLMFLSILKDFATAGGGLVTQPADRSLCYLTSTNHFCYCCCYDVVIYVFHVRTVFLYCNDWRVGQPFCYTRAT